MTQEQIDKINSQCPYNQGIFVQPNHVPVHIKEPVIMSRYVKSGYSGGSCCGDKPTYFTKELPKDHLQVLDLVLQELCPKISYLQYKSISRLIHSNEETDWNYYGNTDDWYCEYIILSELEKFIEQL